MTGLEFGAVEFEVVSDSAAAVVAVMGEVDALTAPVLTAAMAPIAGGDSVEMTLDLAGCTFMGAAGLRTIVETSASLGPTHGMLTIRDASTLILRILDISGVDQLVHLESSTGEPR